MFIFNELQSIITIENKFNDLNSIKSYSQVTFLNNIFTFFHLTLLLKINSIACMKKIYFLIFFLSITFSYAQVSDLNTEKEELETKTSNSKTSIENTTIDGLKMYPNPVTNGIVHIISTENSFKTVQIFNILGKQVLFKILRGNELNISRLDSGIYIVKIREKAKIATRKLVIK